MTVELCKLLDVVLHVYIFFLWWFFVAFVFRKCFLQCFVSGWNWAQHVGSQELIGIQEPKGMHRGDMRWLNLTCYGKHGNESDALLPNVWKELSLVALSWIEMNSQTIPTWWFPNLFCVHPYLGKWFNLMSIFSDGLKPPTSVRFTLAHLITVAIDFSPSILHRSGLTPSKGLDAHGELLERCDSQRKNKEKTKQESSTPKMKKTKQIYGTNKLPSK